MPEIGGDSKLEPNRPGMRRLGQGNEPPIAAQKADSAGEPPAMDAHANRWKLLQIVNIGTFMSTLDVGIVNVSLPAMAAEYGVSLAHIQWAATAYLLAMVASLPFLGRLSDRKDRRIIYSFGFLIFAAGSLWVAAAGGFAGLLAARCLQGIGAAMIMANSQAMVRLLFPDRERGRALGFNAIVISAGTLCGPALGGLLLAFIAWPWLFLVNVPLGAAAFLLGLRLFPAGRGKSDRQPFDLMGSSMLAAGITLAMLAAESVKSGSLPSATLYIGVPALVLLAVFALYESRVSYGIIDRELFSRRNVLVGNISAFLVHLSQTATTLPAAFYLEAVLGRSIWFTGLALMLQPLLLGATAPFAGWFRDRYGALAPVTAGPLLCAASMLYAAAAPGGLTFAAIAVQLALFGAGIGMFQATNNAEIMSAAPAAKISLAGSMLALIRYVGMIAGIGLATLLVGSLGQPDAAGTDTAMHAAMVNHFRILYATCGICCLAVAVLARFRSSTKLQG